jgi:hypothetical protein
MELKKNITNAIEFVDGFDLSVEDKEKLMCKLVTLECVKSKNEELRNEIKELKQGVKNCQSPYKKSKEHKKVVDRYNEIEFRIDYQHNGMTEIYSDYDLWNFIYYLYVDADEVIGRYLDKYAWDEMNGADGIIKELNDNPQFISQMRLSIATALYNEILARCVLNYQRGNRETRFELDIYSSTPKIENRIYIKMLNDLED